MQDPHLECCVDQMSLQDQNLECHMDQTGSQGVDQKQGIQTLRAHRGRNNFKLVDACTEGTQKKKREAHTQRAHGACQKLTKRVFFFFLAKWAISTTFRPQLTA